VRYWYSYELTEICTLFSDLGLHPQTVRKWIKSGLPTIDKGKPALIYGHDLILFLKMRNDASKCPTEFGQIYCFKCKDARHIFRNLISVKPKPNFLEVQAVCRECKARMLQSYKLCSFPRLRNKFTLVDLSELYDLSVSSYKTHIGVQEEKCVTESAQGELF
jgi:hypothetical protein